jgi:enoyl-CoA hydratase/carnithine racemase
MASVMGGGLGILAGCRYRVVSERTRIGMPEITIALFPDVGGSWFLNRMPGQVGPLSGADRHPTSTPPDALYCGLGTHFPRQRAEGRFTSQTSHARRGLVTPTRIMNWSAPVLAG